MTHINYTGSAGEVSPAEFRNVIDHVESVRDTDPALDYTVEWSSANQSFLIRATVEADDSLDAGVDILERAIGGSDVELPPVREQLALG